MTVTVFVKPGCPACVATQRHFQKRSIAYVQAPMNDAVLEVATIAGITAAPIVRVDNGGGNATYWGGYRPDSIDALIA